MTPPLDLDTIEQRARTWRADIVPSNCCVAFPQAVADVLALVAEARRLREALTNAGLDLDWIALHEGHEKAWQGAQAVRQALAFVPGRQP